MRIRFPGDVLHLGRHPGITFSAARPAPSAPPEVPAAGRLLLGALVDTSTGLSGEAGIESREADVGRTYDIRLHYYDWGNDLIGSSEQADKAHGRIPQLSWYGPGSTSDTAPYQLPDVLAGNYDGYIAAQAVRVKNYRGPIFIRWGEEMNGNWYTGYSGHAADYVAAYQRIIGIFRDNGATNVAWVFAPDVDNSKSASPVMDYYPGDDYIDWVGGDGYANATEWSIFSTLWGAHIAAVRAVTQKPFMMCEMACDTTNSKANWITEMTYWLVANADHYNIKALCWFDTNTSSTGTDYRVDSDTAAYNAWKVFAGCQLTGGPNANPSLIPAGAGTVVVSDSFDRPNGTVGNAETGQAWSATGYAIASNELVPTSTSTAYAFVNAGQADCTIVVQVESRTGGPLADGVMFRYVDTTHHAFYRATTGGIFVANGSGAASVKTLNAGSLYRDVYWIVLSGATVTIWRNGVNQGNYTTLPNTTATQHGFRTATNTASAYDNYAIYH